MSLFTKLTIYLLVIVFSITIAINYFSSSYLKTILNNYIGNSNYLLLSNTMNEIDSDLETSFNNLEKISNDKNIIELLSNQTKADNEKALEIISNFENTEVEWLGFVLLDNNSRVLVRTYQSTELPEIKSYTSMRASIIRQLDNNLIEVIKPIRNSYNSREKLGYLIGYLSLDIISDNINTASEGYKISLLDNDGYYIASNKDFNQQDNEIALLIKIIQSDSYSFVYNNSKFDEAITFQTSDLSNKYFNENWYLVMSASTNVVHAPARQISMTYLFLYSLMFLFVIILTLLLLSQKVLTPIKAVTATAEIISQGDFTERLPVKQKDEIGRLSAVFNTMSEELEKSYQNLEQKVKDRTKQLNDKVITINKQKEQLKEAQEATDMVLKDIVKERDKTEQAMHKTQVVVETINDGVVILDTDGRVVSVNKKAREILKLKDNDVTGQMYFDLVKPQTLEGKKITKSNSPCWKALSKDKSVEGKKISMARFDNTRFIAKVSASPLKLKKKIFGVVLVFMDITRESAIDKQKNEFISIASHQLRTPLASSRLMLEMLLQGDMGKLNKDQADFIKEAHESNMRMITLVNDLLNVTRIEEGRVAVDPEATDFVQLVKNVIKDLRGIAEPRKINISIKADKLPEINLDASLIRQVVQNLLTNAVKYSYEEGKVEILIKKKGRFVECSIKDQGYGIPQEDQVNIFHKFYRAHNAVAQETEGNGLGLYLAKSIIESSGGKIWFESVHHEGSTFYFTIPLKGVKAKVGEKSLI